MIVVHLFFGNRSFALLFLPIIIGGFYSCNYFFPYHLPETEANFGFWGRIGDQDFIGYEISALVLIFINAVIINTIFNRNEFMEKNNFLTAMLYVSFLSFFHSFYFLDGLSIAQTLLALMLFQLIKLNQNEDARKIVFNASLLMGLACSFYPILLIGVPFLFWMIWVVRPFVLRESVLIVTGFILPLVYAGLYSYFFQIELDRDEFSSSSSENHPLDLIILGGGMMIFFFMGIKSVLNKIGASTIRLKKLFRILFLLFTLFMSITVLEFFVFSKSDALSLCFIPLVVFLPYAFGIKNLKKAPTLLYYLIMLFAVGKFFIPFSELTF